jgi:hypothetical protein
LKISHVSAVLLIKVPKGFIPYCFNSPAVTIDYQNLDAELWRMEARGEFMTAEEELSVMENRNGETNIYYYQFPDICQLNNYEVLENEFVIREETFSGTGRELAVEDIHLWYQSIEFVKKETWLVKNDFPRIQMNFNLQGNTAYYSNKLEQIFVRFSAGQHNLMLIPEGNIQMQCMPAEHSEDACSGLPIAPKSKADLFDGF